MYTGMMDQKVSSKSTKTILTFRSVSTGVTLLGLKDNLTVRFSQVAGNLETTPKQKKSSETTTAK